MERITLCTSACSSRTMQGVIMAAETSRVFTSIAMFRQSLIKANTLYLSTFRPFSYVADEGKNFIDESAGS